MTRSITHYTSQNLVEKKVLNSAEIFPLCGEGFIPSFDMVCSSRDCCTLSSVKDSHSWMSTCIDMISRDTDATTNYHQVLYSYYDYLIILYRCLLYVVNIYIYRKYLHNGMSKTVIPDEILDDDTFTEMAIWNSEVEAQREELNGIESEMVK